MLVCSAVGKRREGSRVKDENKRDVHCSEGIEEGVMGSDLGGWERPLMHGLEDVNLLKRKGWREVEYLHVMALL